MSTHNMFSLRIYKNYLPGAILSRAMILSDQCLQFISRLHNAVGGRSRDHKFESQLSHITFVEMAHKIISMVFLHFPLIQED